MHYVVAIMRVILDGYNLPIRGDHGVKGENQDVRRRTD